MPRRDERTQRCKDAGFGEILFPFAEVGLDNDQVTELLLEAFACVRNSFTDFPGIWFSQLIRVADSNGLKLPREFALLVKQATRALLLRPKHRFGERPCTSTAIQSSWRRPLRGRGRGALGAEGAAEGRALEDLDPLRDSRVALGKGEAIEKSHL